MTALNEVLVTGRVSPPDWEALGGRGSGDPRPAPPRCRHMGGTPYLPKKNEIRGWRREGPEPSSGTGKGPEGPGRCDRRKALGGEGMMSSPSGDSSKSSRRCPSAAAYSTNPQRRRAPPPPSQAALASRLKFKCTGNTQTRGLC